MIFLSVTTINKGEIMTITREDLQTTDFSSITTGETIKPVPPGEHLAGIMEDCGISAYKLAKDIRVGQTRISEILRGKRAISADTAARLGVYFSMSAQFWMNLQTNYNLFEIDLHDEIIPLAVA